MSNKTDKINELVKIRLKLLRPAVRRARLGSYILIGSLVALSTIKWLIITPFLDRAILSLARGEYLSMPLYLKISPFLIGIIGLAMSFGYLFYAMYFGRINKIRYSISTDVCRMVMYFATLVKIMNSLGWIFLGYLLIHNQTESMVGLVDLIRNSDSSSTMMLSVVFVIYSYEYIKHSRITKSILKINPKLFIVFVILNVVSIVEFVLLIPFLLYTIIRPKIFYLFVYTDILKKRS